MPAPMLSRMLAVFVDYLVLTSLSILGMRFVDNPDLLFVPNFILAALYLGVGSSRVTAGQTLGKKAFGIRVVSAVPLSGGPYISVGRALLRFFCLCGAIICLSDIPPNIYRQISLAADPRLLELHMWIALTFTFTGVALVLLLPSHRGLHDLIAKTIVVRGPQDMPAGAGKEAIDGAAGQKAFFSPALTAPAIGAAFGTLLWLHGVEIEPEMLRLVSHRYQLEHDLPIRVQGIRKADDKALFAAEVADSYRLSDEPLPGSIELAQTLGNKFLGENLVAPAEIKSIIFAFTRISKSAQTGLTFKVDQIEFNTADKTVKELPPEF